MACKASHVQDNSVVERRLRPIYEWLDSGNNKKALQECEKVLKKTPNLQCAKALKSLSLLRLGKESDCISILEALSLENLSDEATLQAITLCYRELQQLEKICKLYETAVKLEPTNEELLTHLFMSYVRISNFKLQQQTAMSLYKFKPKNPYYCWAVMSVILQATCGTGSTDIQKRSLLLSLAERMIDKLITDNKLDAEQEAQLYIMVLELQNKYEEILNVFNGPIGSKLLKRSLQYSILPYLIKLRNWHDVNLECKKILVDNMDKWDIWKEYINSVMYLMKSETHIINNHVGNNCTNVEDDLETVDNTPEKAHEFICRLVENGTDNAYLLRGPYLARFELCSKLTNNNIDTTDLLGETVELFIEYFRKFGDRSCCVSDLRQYLRLLDNEKKSDLSVRLIKDVGISSTSVPQNIQQMQRHICALQLSRLSGSHRNLSIDHLRALVTAFSLHYQHGYQTYGTNLLVTDQGPSDPYALLAAHVLYDLYQLTKSSNHLIVALALLENLLKNSPSNFHAKLLCVKLYHCLGGAIGAQTMYESLDVKHLQLDSMGYIHCARLPTTGLYTIAASLYASTVKFFSSNYKDSSDHLTFSYKFGSFLKLGEFMDFRERVNNSLHYTTISVERVLLNLVQCNSIENFYAMDVEPRDTPILWDKIRGNHDLSVYTSWDPVRIEVPPEETAEIQSLYDQNMKCLKLRHKIILAISEVIKVGKSTDGVRSKHLGNLTNIVKDWMESFKTISKNVSPPLTQSLINMPLPSRLHAFQKAPYVDVLGEFFKLIEVVASDGEKIMENANGIQDAMKNIVEDIVKAIDDQNNSTDFYWGNREILEYVVNIVEIFSISSLLLVACFDIIKVPQGRKTKRKSNDLKLREYLQEITGKLKCSLIKLDSTLEKWKISDECNLSEQLMALNLNTDGHSNVLTNLKNSHIIAIKELKTVLRSKSKLLDTLIS